jgi:hypothetical protein
MSQNYNSPTTSPTTTPAADQPRIEDNDDALLTNFSGPSAPSSPIPGQHWFDTTSKILYVRKANNSGWGICSNPEKQKNISVNTTLDSTFESSFVSVTNNPVITLPQFSSVSNNYQLTLCLLDNLGFRLHAHSGENFYRNNTSHASITIPPSTVNSYFKIGKTNGRFLLAGSLGGLDKDLTTLDNAGKKVALDLTYPVGTEKGFLENVTPPLQGVLGVSWTVIAEGYTTYSATTSDTGTIVNGERLDTGDTEGHALTVNELPAHSHSFSIPTTGGGGSPQISPFQLNSDRKAIRSSGSANVEMTGSSSPHIHPLQITNIKVLIYKRMS